MTLRRVLVACVVRIEADDNLLIHALAAWQLTRDSPERARAAANAVIDACGSEDVEALVVALRARGWAERVVFSHEAAHVSLGRAARLARKHGLLDRLVEVLVTRAGVYLEVGNFGAAHRDVRAARSALGGTSTSELDGQEAVIEAKRGELIRAVGLSRRARSTLAEDATPVARVTTLNNLAMSLIQIGATDEADEVLAEALPIAAALGTLVLGTVTQTQALAAVRGGRLALALERFDRAEAILKDAGWPLGEVYLERVDSLVTLRLVAEADEAALRAIRLLDGPGGAMLLAEALLHHARVLGWDGRGEDAARSAERAVTLFRRQRRSAFRAQAELVAVEVCRSGGRSAPGDTARVRRAAGVLERAGLLLETVDAHLLLGRLAITSGRAAAARSAFTRAGELAHLGPSLLRIKGHLAAAFLATTGVGVQRAAKSGLEELSRFRSSLPTTELRALASAHGVELAEFGLEAALAKGRPADILEWMERGRLASALVSPPRVHDLEIAEGLANIREVAARQRSGGDDSDEFARLRSEQARIETRIQRRMRAISPQSIAADTSARTSEIDGALGRDSALVAFAVVRERLVAVTLAGRRRIHQLGDAGRVRSEVDGLLFGLRQAARARTPTAQDVARAGIAHSLELLNAMLIAPLVSDLGDREQVVVVPTARLFPVPWHALAALSGRSVSVSPSATMWHRAVARPARPGPVVAIAGPDLPGATEEATRVAALYPEATLLVPPRSTADSAVIAMNCASVAHLACHGTFRADNPSFSSLELSDGPLTMVDLERIGRTPDVVILAACDTGASEVLPGEELRGFLTSLLVLGTRVVVASAVPVPDLDTASMMVALHAELCRGATVGAALRRAQATRDISTVEGLITSLAFGCFGAGEVTVGGAS